MVIFGEVIPQAYCTGAKKVRIGYIFAPFIRFLQVLFYVFVYPITYVLDNWLGHHEDKIVLTTENLHSILLLHDRKEYGYRPEEIKILQNTVDLRLKKIKTEMIPIKSVFMLNENREVDKALLKELETHNYSKIPVFSGNLFNIVGYVKVKNLLIFKNSPSRLIKNSKAIHPIAKLNESMTLLDAIGQLKQKNINFAMVYD